MAARARHPMQAFCRRPDRIDRVKLVTWNVASEDGGYAFFRIEGDADAYRDRIPDVDSIRT